MARGGSTGQGCQSPGAGTGRQSHPTQRRAVHSVPLLPSISQVQLHQICVLADLQTLHVPAWPQPHLPPCINLCPSAHSGVGSVILQGPSSSDHSVLQAPGWDWHSPSTSHSSWSSAQLKHLTHREAGAQRNLEKVSLTKEGLLFPTVFTSGFCRLECFIFTWKL